MLKSKKSQVTQVTLNVGYQCELWNNKDVNVNYSDDRFEIRENRGFDYIFIIILKFRLISISKNKTKSIADVCC